MTDSGVTKKDRSPGFLRLTFGPDDEIRYRDFLRGQLRYLRTGLFLVLAMGFGLAPLYQPLLFRPSDSVLPLLLVLELFCVLPITLAAMVVSYFPRLRLTTQAVQSAAVLTVFLGVIAIRHLALLGEMHYPAIMVGVVLIAVSFFGRFDWHRIMPVSILVTLLAIAQEFLLRSPATDPLINTYALMLMAVVAVFGSYSQEVVSRWNWRDMIRLRDAQTALRESEERYRFMADSSPNLVWNALPNGRLEYVNHEMVLFTGYTAEELQDNWRYTMHPDDIAGYLTRWKSCLSTGDPFEHESRLRRSDGVYRWCLTRAVLFSDDGGRPVKWFGTTVDVDDLNKAREAAESATQVKGEFLANMSHEIRTPLNAIIGMTSILLDSKQNEEQKEQTEVIRRSGEHLLEVINEILDFSKIEAGKVEVESQAFSLRDCVESAMDFTAVGATQKNVEIGYLMQSNTPEGIHGDISRLRQVLLNLLSNAVKFTPSGGQISVEVSAPDHRYTRLIHFSVKDSGIGIAREQQARLFKPFSQADSSTTRVHGGTGLGLSISKRLVELMGGRIWVESEPDKGSAFCFTIKAPLAKLDREMASDSQAASLRNCRVLIVDDVDVNRRILMHYAELWGMLCQATNDPQEALDWIARGDMVDLALIDYHMPGMDGFELAVKLRQHRSAEELPIVMLSSAAEMGDVPAAVTAALQKPIKPARLLQAIQDILQRTPDTEPEETKPNELPRQLGQEHPLRVLLAEDNVVNQRVAQFLFKKIGYELDIAADGQETLDAVERQPYDVVFMDVQMPVMDGLETTRKLCRRYGPDRRPRIIGMSASAAAEERDKALEAGMEDYIAKPITPVAIIAALRQCARLP